MTFLKRVSPVWVLFVFVQIIGVAFAEDPAIFQKNQQEYRESLRHVGFEDYSARIDHTLRTRHNLDSTQRKVLRKNKARFQIFTDTAELSSFLFAHLEKDPTKSRVNLLTVITARMLALQPVDAPREFPPEVENAKGSEDDRWNERVDHIRKLATKNALDQLNEYSTDILTFIYGKKKLKELLETTDPQSPEFLEYVKTRTWVEGKLMSVIKMMYTDPQMGQTRFLGRALAANLYRYSKIHHNDSVLKKLRSEVADRNLDLRNFLGAQVVADDQHGNKVVTDVRNGDFLTEHSVSKEAVQIAWAARPHRKNWIFAWWNGYLGHWYDQVMVPEDVTLPEEMSLKDRIRFKAAREPFFNNGASHVGIARVLEDSSIGLKMAWAIDAYPNDAEGGIRIIGIMDNFAAPGEFIRVGVARYDAKKFRKFALEQTYQPIVWKTRAEEFDDSGDVQKVSDSNVVEWKQIQSEQDFNNNILNFKGSDEEFYKVVMGRTVDYIVTEMATGSAVGFDYGFLGAGHRAYCSLTINLASLMANGLDLQKDKDTWNLFLVGAKRANVKEVRDMNLNQRIIAPNGFAWQKGLVSKGTAVTYRPLSEKEVQTTMTYPETFPLDAQAAWILGELRGKANSAHSGLRQNLLDLQAEFLDSFDEAIRGEARKRTKSAEVALRSGIHRSMGFVHHCVLQLEQVQNDAVRRLHDTVPFRNLFEF